ncbi:MAG: hypothetical protein K5669_03410 [Lachnospiraceae bacterium]|nr:hypothetical protein [Lachnospiraceae bacterium]
MNNLVSKIKKVLTNKEKGIDGILVTIGLCIIALVLCVVMKDALADMIANITGQMSVKAQQILTGAVLVRF